MSFAVTRMASEPAALLQRLPGIRGFCAESFAHAAAALIFHDHVAVRLNRDSTTAHVEHDPLHILCELCSHSAVHVDGPLVEADDAAGAFNRRRFVIRRHAESTHVSGDGDRHAVGQGRLAR